jgi:hypothetical protein
MAQDKTCEAKEFCFTAVQFAMQQQQDFRTHLFGFKYSKNSNPRTCERLHMQLIAGSNLSGKTEAARNIAV